MIELPHGVDVTLRLVARAWLLVVIAIFTWEAAQGNIPRDPEGGPFTDDVLVPLQLGLLILAAIAWVVSSRWLAPAAVLVALAGGGLGVLAALQYEPPFGLLVLVAFLVPAVLMWLAWQHRETLGKIVALAVGTALLLTGSWIGSNRIYATYLGPTHPQSSTEALPSSPVRWLWSGAVESTGFTVTTRLRDEAESAQLVVRDADGVEVARSSDAPVPDADEPVSLVVDGLEPATDYGYAVEIDGEIDEVNVGEVQTFPDGAASFTVAVASCAGTNSNGVVFDTIRELGADLYVNSGDLHYRNIGDDDVDQFRSAFAQVHAAPAQAALYRSLPIAYVWDDHDYGPNDSDASSASRPAAWAAYRAHVPHYELPSGDEGPIHQAFSIGRVRFVMVDTRSNRDPAAATMLGDAQLEWLLAELLAAHDSHALTVWISPTPWIGAPDPTSEHWGGFAAERERIGRFLAEHDISNLVMLSGDAHMVAVDDGTNSGYGGHGGFPVLQAAALDRPGSIKGGPYSHGTFPGGGQFGTLEITDQGGDRIEVRLAGYDYESNELVSLEVDFSVD